VLQVQVGLSKLWWSTFESLQHGSSRCQWLTSKEREFAGDAYGAASASVDGTPSRHFAGTSVSGHSTKLAQTVAHGGFFANFGRIRGLAVMKSPRNPSLAAFSQYQGK
jgi:hypothetical protein